MCVLPVTGRSGPQRFRALRRVPGAAAIFVVLAWLASAAAPADADVFRYRDAADKSVEVDARLAGSGQGMLALELDDGQYRLVPEGAVENRQLREGPQALDGAGVASRLQEQFGVELFRSLVKDPYVIGLVLATPLPKTAEGRTKGFLARVAGFLKNVDTAFASFLKETRVPAEAPAHPLVVLIFETEVAFNRYTQSITGDRGPSVGRIAGFYSGITNFLAIRLGECKSFDVPLHEAIHQQVYNRSVFQRLAPIPHWFDEGIATGFEGNQGKVAIGPTKISPRYARQALEARELTFEKMLVNDIAFSGDVLLGEAYGGAWGLHWLLVTKYRNQYGKYVRLLAEKEPLAVDSPEQRLADFEDAFGKDLAAIDREFRPQLESGIRKQKVVLHPERPAGLSFTQQNVGEVELTAISRVDAGGRMEVQGKLTNVSPLRAMAFHVTVETDSGTYADWHVPSLDVQKSTPLALQFVAKLMRGGRGGPSRTFSVRIRSAPTDSAEAAAWSQGRLPVPEFSR